MRRLSRRDLLGKLVTAGTATLLAPRQVSSQTAPITIADRPVEIAVASISPNTVRISVAPIENSRPHAIPDEGSLVQAAWVPPRTRFRNLSRRESVRLGNVVPDELE